ncbi:LysM peptidoglycan-binding domain-containing protein [Halalkalibacter alkalisediminis]|uniref:LysM peptidoglycan-binding domain-containing protein n=1 Tax=Halalkalibacter alkalisediminis TaxID=935616 RepID=A0ABV6NEW4_9BACI|nr:LysM peptidoglycan-binding domain-containing protein [Halalkalibacter alkalisediminis]
MEMIKHNIKKLDPNTSTYALVVYLDAFDTEFAEELGTETSSQNTFIFLCKNIVKKHYPSLKITAIQVVMGGILITTLPVMATSASASSERTAQAQSIYYQVGPGDSLRTIARAHNVTVDSIKRANPFTTDVIQQNQRLIILKAFHTVSSGDSLSVLARDYGTTITAIRETNHLTSDSIRTGQLLAIPTLLKPSATPTHSTQQTTHTVKSGDSLSAIAKTYGMTVEELRSTNHLSTELIRIGQTLVIPNSATPEPTFKIQPIDQVYTVVSGDSLSVIASRFGVSADALRSANQLKSDNLQIGLRLVIPNPKTITKTPIPVPKYTTYTVVSGDSLWAIASHYRVTVDGLRKANSLKSDILQVGQKLVIPTNSSADEATPTPPTSTPTSSYSVSPATAYL